MTIISFEINIRNESKDLYDIYNLAIEENDEMINSDNLKYKLLF